MPSVLQWHRPYELALLDSWPLVMVSIGMSCFAGGLAALVRSHQRGRPLSGVVVLAATNGRTTRGVGAATLLNRFFGFCCAFSGSSCAVLPVKSVTAGVVDDVDALIFYKPKIIYIKNTASQSPVFYIAQDLQRQVS